MKKYLRLLRVKHWIKNLLILFPMAFGLDFSKASYVLVGCIAFCMLSSVIYIINDCCDLDSDRAHPRKSTRPLASGEVSVRSACLLAALIIMLMLAILVYRRNVSEIVCFVFYFAVNVIYSKCFKNIALLDVSSLTACYIIRLLYGGIISDIEISDWMFLTVLSASCYLSFGKRRNELRMYGDENRKSLKMYNVNFLDRSVQSFMTLTLVFYSLSCADQGTVIANAGINFIWSVPVMFLIFLRYNMLLESDDCDGDPVDVVMHDVAIWCLIIGYIAVFAGMILVTHL